MRWIQTFGTRTWVITFPGASMVAWIAGCGRGLVAQKRVEGATDITDLRFDAPKAENPRIPFKPLLPGFLRSTNGFRGGDVAIVLV